MSELDQLIATLKRQLKARGMTYRDLAGELGLSEASVKRLFASGSFSLERLLQIRDQVARVLDPDRDPDQRIGQADLLAQCFGHARMRG